MKKFSRFVFTCVLPLFLLTGGLLGANAALATDTDGDGLPDAATTTQVSAGGDHTCALDDTGVHCWGNNYFGQTTVPTLVNPIAVSAGYSHSCALDDGGLHCWGRNINGQINVPPLTNPVAVSAGSTHTCALDDTGVHCWGDNGQGQINVPPLTNPVAVTAGRSSTCAIDNTGAHCWGDNGQGQLNVPVLVTPTAVSVGYQHTCALDSTGVHCWGGDNGYGQTTVPALVNPVAVSTGESHTCAIDDTGLHCWGAGKTNIVVGSHWGQSIVPVLVNPVAVSAGPLNTCAVDDTGVHCWGKDDLYQSTVPAQFTTVDNCPHVANADQLDTDGDGQGDACDTDDDNDNVPDITDTFPLNSGENVDTDNDGTGDNADTDDDGDSVPDATDAFPLDPTESMDTDSDGTGNNADTDDDGDGIVDALSVSAGDYHTCALDAAGVHCWGGYEASTRAVPALVNPVAVSSGGAYSCALDDTGVHCWGEDDYDQTTTVPVLVNPVAVSAGGNHACAIDDTGVKCWGRNIEGQSSVPPLVSPVAVSAGGVHTCAIDNTGLHCWGAGTTNAGNIHFGQSIVPVLVNPVAVSAGLYHTCALDDTGVHCWGAGITNTGSGYERGQSIVPTLVNPVAVSAGGNHSCAIDDTGLHCWGANYYGQITVPTLVNPVAVTTGFDHTCAIDDTGVHCWGRNTVGQATVPALSADNCPQVANVNQLNNDGDAQGDICDTDDDNDGVIDTADAFPFDGTETVDTDGDNLGDNGDPIIDDANTLNNIFGEIKTDKAGSSVAFAGDFNGDGYGDYVIGIPGFDVSTKIKDAGRAVVISGKTGAELASVEGIAAKDAMGFAVAGGGDINHDGFDDVVIGAPFADHLPLKDTGSVTVLYGRSEAELNPAQNETFYGTAAKILSGSALALGNVDDDDHADIVIGAPKADDVANKHIDAGSVTIIDGDTLVALPDIYYGATAKAYAGISLATGNVDVVAGADIIIGAPNDDDVDNKRKDAGSVTVYNITDAIEPVLKKYGAVAKAFLGKSVAAGDVNNDGFTDVVAGAPGDDNGKLKDVGSVTIFYGDDALIPKTFYGATAKAGLGNSVAAGNVDADVGGFAEIIAGAKLDDKPSVPKSIKDTGSVSVWSGNGYSQIGSTLYGDVSKDYFGTSVAAGDVNSDGHADLIIGIPGFDIPATSSTKIIKDAGAVKVQSGSTQTL